MCHWVLGCCGVLQCISLQRKFLEIVWWSSVNLTNFPKLSNLSGIKCLTSFKMLKVCLPILWLWFLRFPLAIYLLFLSKIFFIVTDWMAFKSSSYSYLDFDMSLFKKVWVSCLYFSQSPRHFMLWIYPILCKFTNCCYFTFLGWRIPIILPLKPSLV